MRTPDGIHAVAYELLHLIGADNQPGQPGIRITLAPLPVTEDSHKCSYTLDAQTAGVDRVVQAQRNGAPHVTPASVTGTEAA